MPGRGRPQADSGLISGLAAFSIAAATFDAFVGTLAVAEVVREVDEAFAELIGVVVIAMLLTTALPPILRRVQRPVAGPGVAGHAPARTPAEALAEQVLAAVGRIEELNSGPGIRAPEIRRECERLRELARSFSG